MQQSADSLYTLDQVKSDPQHDYVLATRAGEAPRYRRVMSTDECYDAAVQEWLEVLAQLWVAFGKALDGEQMIIYQKNLKVVPLGLLDQAINRVIREHRFSSVPTVAQVWAAVRTELHNPVDLDYAIESWLDQQWTNCHHRFAVAAETEVEPI